jgi:hypothetical protein
MPHLLGLVAGWRFRQAVQCTCVATGSTRMPSGLARVLHGMDTHHTAPAPSDRTPHFLEEEVGVSLSFTQLLLQKVVDLISGPRHQTACSGGEW